MKRFVLSLLSGLLLLEAVAGTGRGAAVITAPAQPPVFIPVLPLPRQVETYPVTITLTDAIAADASLPAAAWERLRDHWKKSAPASVSGTPEVCHTSKVWHTSAAVKLLLLLRPGEKNDTALRAMDLSQLGDEGYVLILRPHQRLLAAYTETGLFYGLQTLKQLLRAHWNKELVITDWPQFPLRAVYDDISRGPISTVAYIKQQIERMAECKINCLSFYIEHVVQTVSHPDFAPANGKLTIADIRELSAYARSYHMQLGGSFQSFGHFEKILALPQYASLGATPNLISPQNAAAHRFLADVIGELCDAFGAPWFNVNCDETFDLGQGSTKPFVDSFGATALYARQIRFLYDVVKKHGRQMMMWGDFAVQHPELLDQLPKDIIYLTWEYGDQASFDHWIKPFADRHLHFMVCPGILNSYRMFPDMVMARANIGGFSKAGAATGAEGVMTTVWDDGGTYLFSGDWYGVYVAAEKSWNTNAEDKSFAARYERTAYGTGNGEYVKALSDLMELRRIPLTYDLSDRLWQQKILPDSGKKAILNNKGIDEAERLLQAADAHIRKAAPVRHRDDAATLAFSIAQYRLMLDTRTAVARLAAGYDTKHRQTQWRTAAVAQLNTLIDRYRRLRQTFKDAWLRENQPWWLDKTLAPFDKKIAVLSGLSKGLAERPIAGNEQGKKQLRLNILVSNDFYFQNWMLAGLFPLAGDRLPAFLYGETPEYNKPPSPGDVTQYLGKQYRWRKYASPDGGIIDAAAISAHGDRPAALYAYCSITTDAPLQVPAYIGTAQDIELYCNGGRVQEKVARGALAGESGWMLPLKKGANAILLKYRVSPGRDNTFTFRVDPVQHVTNHKHKYQLNAKTETHDAE